MQTLEKMGIQRWRLRLPSKSAGLEPAKSRLETVDEVLSGADANEDPDWQGLTDLITQVNYCPRCAQHKPFLGNGDVNAKWMFVIEAPSLHDIQQQKMLSGRAGQLFDGILVALGMHRDEIYLTAVFKCPASEDIQKMAQCDKLIHHQIRLVQPQVVFTFGELAAQMVIKANEGLAILRSKSQHCFSNDLPIVPSHGLQEVLSNPLLKAELWADLKLAKSNIHK